MLNQGGLLDYWKQQEYQKRNKPELNLFVKSRSAHTFSIKQLQSLLYVLILSIMLSTFCLICELIYSSLMKSGNNNQ